MQAPDLFSIHSSSLDMDCHCDTETVDGCKLSYKWIEQEGLQDDWLKRQLVVSGKWEEQSKSPPVKLEVAIRIENWSLDNYVLLPAAVYDGNRFEVLPLPYPPMFPKGDLRKTIPATITDIPRLNVKAGASRFDLLVTLGYVSPRELFEAEVNVLESLDFDQMEVDNLVAVLPSRSDQTSWEDILTPGTSGRVPSTTGWVWPSSSI